MLAVDVVGGGGVGLGANALWLLGGGGVGGVGDRGAAFRAGANRVQNLQRLSPENKDKVISEVIKYHQSSFRKHIYIQTDETDELKNRPSVS